MINKYYQKYKDRSTCRKKYASFTKVEKDKRQKMTRERYQNFTEEEKKKVVSIIKKVSKSYQSIEEIIILDMKSNCWNTL